MWPFTNRVGFSFWFLLLAPLRDSMITGCLSFSYDDSPTSCVGSWFELFSCFQISLRVFNVGNVLFNDETFSCRSCGLQHLFFGLPSFKLLRSICVQIMNVQPILLYRAMTNVYISFLSAQWSWFSIYSFIVYKLLFFKGYVHW